MGTTVLKVRSAARRASFETCDVDVPELTLSKTGGPFDVVLFLGVFYHLFDPIDGLRRAAEQAREVLVVESHIDPEIKGLDRSPMMVYYPNGYADDLTNHWGPNEACIVALLKKFGFSRVDVS